VKIAAALITAPLIVIGLPALWVLGRVFAAIGPRSAR
jgi:hypothetical protein